MCVAVKHDVCADAKQSVDDKLLISQVGGDVGPPTAPVQVVVNKHDTEKVQITNALGVCFQVR